MKITKETKKIIFARNLHSLMTMHDMTRRDMCEALKIPRETLRNWMNAIEYPRLEKIAILADYFKVDISYLIQEHNVFEGLNKQDIQCIHGMQKSLFTNDVPLINIQMFTAAAVYVLKYLKENNYYGGKDHE